MGKEQQGLVGASPKRGSSVGYKVGKMCVCGPLCPQDKKKRVRRASMWGGDNVFPHLVSADRWGLGVLESVTL